MRDSVFSCIKKEMDQGENLILILGDLGVYQAEKIKNYHNEKVINIGILEQAMVSYAAGLSYGGITPIIYSITPFITERVTEQIKLDVSYNRNNVIFISAGGTCDYTDLGPTHHAPNDMNVMCSYPYLEWHLPFSNEDSKIAIKNAIQNKNSSHYIRLSNENFNQDLYEGGNNDVRQAVKKTQIRGIEEICLDIGPDSKYMQEETYGITKYIRIRNQKELEQSIERSISEISIKKIHIRCPFTIPRKLLLIILEGFEKCKTKDWYIYDIDQTYLDECVTKENYFEKTMHKTKL